MKIETVSRNRNKILARGQDAQKESERKKIKTFLLDVDFEFRRDVCWMQEVPTAVEALGVCV